MRSTGFSIRYCHSDIFRHERSVEKILEIVVNWEVPRINAREYEKFEKALHQSVYTYTSSVGREQQTQLQHPHPAVEWNRVTTRQWMRGWWIVCVVVTVSVVQTLNRLLRSHRYCMGVHVILLFCSTLIFSVSSHVFAQKYSEMNRKFQWKYTILVYLLWYIECELFLDDLSVSWRPFSIFLSFSTQV